MIIFHPLKLVLFLLNAKFSLVDYTLFYSRCEFSGVVEVEHWPEIGSSIKSVKYLIMN